MAFDSREYEWADITVILGGVDVTGIRNIKYKKKVEREAIYAKGRDPHSIQTGNNSYEGELEILQSDFDALERASDNDITSLIADVLISFGNPSDPADTIKTDKVISIRINETETAAKQGDKFMPVTLPFTARGIQKNV